MQLDNLSIAYLVREVAPLFEGAFVNNVSETEGRRIKVKLHTKQGSKGLIIAGNAFFITKYSLQARHGKSNFPVALKKELYNKRIVSIEQHDLDRVVSIRFLEHTLVLELLGEGNQILLNKQGKILSCARNEEWADRKIRKGETYAFPRHHQNPATLTVARLRKAFSESDKDGIRALLSTANISPLVAEELFFRQKIGKAKPARDFNDTEIGKLVSGLHGLYSPESAEYAPVAYKNFVFPFRLGHLNEEPVPIASLNDCLDEALASAGARPKEETARLEASHERSSKLEHVRSQQGAARRKFEQQVSENTRKGELIYGHYNEIDALRKAALEGIEKGLPEKKILEAFQLEAAKGNKAASLLKSLDVKKKTIELEL